MSYRFRCPGPGVFLCESTGLVFVMVQEAELLYRTVQWDERLLRSADKVAAGLLFDIKCSENAAVCQLHLPHCEVMDGKDSTTGPSQPKLTKLIELIIWRFHIIKKNTVFSFFFFYLFCFPFIVYLDQQFLQAQQFVLPL